MSPPHKTTPRLHTTLLRILGTLALATTLPTGCTTPAETRPTEQVIADAMEQRGKFWAELDDIQNLLGGTWEKHDDPLANSCPGSNRETYKYSGDRIRSEALPDPIAGAEQLTTYFSQLGYTVTPQSFAPNHHAIIARDANGWNITVTTYRLKQDMLTTIAADTGCFRGNSGLISDYQSRLIREERARTSPSPSPSRY
ncbi:hypothetical protein [Mycetocola spongiae]|uniref:hypothetical protein n=1 Tax=Mycetocola spongiae TaxID=2859226 RepID=UPI001CF491A3|nr:hypothetical protein [Mycetocola spongiae]UCR90270.1 hypothetical protein KXZ72_06345 [Mycetocola spongiae]